MCGIFGFVGAAGFDRSDIDVLVRHSQQRGRDSSGVVINVASGYQAYRADFSITKLLRKVDVYEKSVFFGHSRLITNGLTDNQPVIRDGIYVIHNGIVVNHELLWDGMACERRQDIDTEVIAALATEHLEAGGSVADLAETVLRRCMGIVACALAIPRLGKLVLFSNNGSLYVGEKASGWVFASEEYGLTQIGCKNVRQITDAFILDIPTSSQDAAVTEWANRKTDLVPALACPLTRSGFWCIPSPSSAGVPDASSLRRCRS